MPHKRPQRAQAPSISAPTGQVWGPFLPRGASNPEHFCTGPRGSNIRARVPRVAPTSRATKDLFLTQRFARHANPITTVAYTHPSDEKIGGL